MNKKELMGIIADYEEKWNYETFKQIYKKRKKAISCAIKEFDNNPNMLFKNYVEDLYFGISRNNFDTNYIHDLMIILNELEKYLNKK